MCSSKPSAWLALGLACPRVSPSRLYEAFDDVEEMWHLPPDVLAQSLTISEAAAGRLLSPQVREQALELAISVHEAGQTLLCFPDEAYPERLRQIADPPAFLCVDGQLPPSDAPAVAIVGARDATMAGATVARYFSQELARLGVWIVSGGARGIDAAAHQGALLGGGGTVAVRGSGLDIDYPSGHKSLYRDIATAGASLSEYSPGILPKRAHFPRRNRIIAGMSLGVLVVEAGARSGALVTARLALEMGREVMAVPGALDSALAVGTNRLIQQGAKLVMSVEDVTEELLPQLSGVTRPSEEGQAVSELGRKLLKVIAEGPADVDQLAAAAKLPSASLMEVLLGLELSGLLVQLPGGRYRLGAWGRAR